jgi:hypothetical protein
MLEFLLHSLFINVVLQTTHLRFLNSIAKCVAALNMPKEHEHSAYRFHTDLFLSGLERVILVCSFCILLDLQLTTYAIQISRKASTTYYPTLHLELARYIDHAIQAGYELPYTVARLIGVPPPPHAKDPQPSSTQNGSARHQPSTPTRSRPVGHGSVPCLPSPVKVEPLRFG